MVNVGEIRSRPMNLEAYIKPIEARYPPSQILGEVFPTPCTREKLLGVLREIPGEVEVGGRSVRTAVGFQTLEMADKIQHSAWYDLTVHEQLRLRTLVRVLREYPTQRMLKKDLDLFTESSDLEPAFWLLAAGGFNPRKVEATGGVRLIEVEGENGQATIVSRKDSWQRNPPWPMMGWIGAVLDKECDQFILGVVDEETRRFRKGISAGRRDFVPLEMPGVERLDVLDPRRLAAVSRAMVWMATVKANGQWLNLPDWNILEAMIATAGAAMKQLDKDMGPQQLLPGVYRDFALGMFFLTLRDESGDREYDAFLGRLRGATLNYG